MQEERDLTAGEKEFESALASLHPGAATVDVVELAYEAGRRSARGQLRLWRSCAAMLALALAGVGIVAMPKSTAPTDQLLAQGDVPGAAPVVMAAGPSYWQVRDEILENGLAALPAPAPGNADAVIYRAVGAPVTLGRTQTGG